ncbi:MAG: RidA family protein [bacterium]
MNRKIISTPKAPGAIGPYSQAVHAGSFLFISGQISINPATAELELGDIQTQTKRVMNNIQAIVEEAGGSMNNVVKTTIFLKNLSDFNIVNEVYAGYFETEPPARATVEVSGLPKGVGVEIEAVVFLEK